MYDLTLLLQRIARTLPLELDCSEFATHAPILVDAMMDCRTDGSFDLMNQHMFQCHVCQEEFVLLAEVTRLARSDFAPQIPT